MCLFVSDHFISVCMYVGEGGCFSISVCIFVFVCLFLSHAVSFVLMINLFAFPACSCSAFSSTLVIDFPHSTTEHLLSLP